MRAKRLHLKRYLQLCCICRNERDHVVVFCSSNEMPSDLFMNYLFGTAPLCSVLFFFFILFGVMSLSDC